MDLILFLVAFMLGFGVFISSAYLLAKWIFPKLEEDGEYEIRTSPKRDMYAPHVSKKNPYSFK